MGAALQLSFEKQPLANAKEVNYKRYSNFKNLDEFNAHWEQFMACNKTKYTKLQIRALRIVRQFAAKYPGVCYVRYSKLEIAAEQEYGHKISRDTFRTALDKTENLGGLVKYDGVRLKNGRGSRTANVVIFSRIEDVRIYQAAKKAQEEAEIKQFLEQEYAKASALNNYAANARKWAEEKAERQRKKAEAAERAEKAKKERQQAAKKPTLFTKVLEVLKAAKLDTSNINEYMGIMYGSIKKTMAADKKVTQARAEQIALEQLYVVAATPEQDIKKSRAAYLSHLLRRNLIALVQGYTTDELRTKRAKNSGKKVGVVPDWYNKSDAEKEAEQRKRAAEFNTPEMQAKVAALKARLEAEL